MKGLSSTLIFLIAICNTMSCQQAQTYSFTKIACSPEPTPEFDVTIAKVVASEGQPEREVILNKIPKKRTVFKPCRELIYNAVFFNETNEIITTSQIKLMATGKRWEFQPEKQDEVKIQFEYDTNQEALSKKYQLNKTLEGMWVFETIEGVVENEEEVWMHPFRHNQFNFTEVAPFPKVELPLFVGKTYNGSLSLQNGWGDWENQGGNMTYEVVKKETIQTKYGQIRDCWFVQSISNFIFGSSKADFWYSEQYGFVKMEYVNYGKQRLTFELAAVNNN